MSKLTKAQRHMLAKYAEHDVPTTSIHGSMSTFHNLVRRGFINRSYGPGWIEAEATPAGRLALKEAEEHP